VASIQAVDNGTTNGREKVRDYILTRFKGGDKLPKVNELSKKLKTSEYAAERAMTELSAEGLVQRKPRFGSVLVDRIEKISTVNSLTDTRSIAFMADELESFLSGEIMRGVEAHCRGQKIPLSLLNSNYSSETEEDLIRNLANNHCSGAVVRVGEHMVNLRILEDMIPPGFPVVLVDRSDEDLRFPCVKMNQEEAGYEATKHLIDLGHRRIAHLTYDDKSRPLLKEMQKRKEGYQKALHEAALEIRPEYIQGGALFGPDEEPSPTYYNALGYAPMNRLLLQKKRPTAVFLLHFYFVFGALKAIEDHGLRVPEDISIICIDDEAAAAHLNPPITVYAQPLREIGATATSLLADMIDGKSPEKKCYRLQGHLIQRGSTASVKSDNTV
jgi:DNA-binding LacI/PurR family transcriptional regulator